MKKNRTLTKIANFMKKNMYYVLLFVCVAAVGTMITMTIINANEPDISIEAPAPDNNTPPAVEPEVILPEPSEPDTEVGGTDDQPVVDEPDTEVTAEPIVFGLPVDGTICSAYSDNELVYCSTLERWQTHAGVDYACSEGAEVMSVYGGVVESVTNDSLNGIVVTVNHGDGLYTKYGALSEANVEVGQTVSKGDVVGLAGNTALSEVNLGTHLHFETILDGKSVNPAVYSGENK